MVTVSGASRRRTMLNCGALETRGRRSRVDALCWACRPWPRAGRRQTAPRRPALPGRAGRLPTGHGGDSVSRPESPRPAPRPTVARNRLIAQPADRPLIVPQLRSPGRRPQDAFSGTIGVCGRGIGSRQRRRGAGGRGESQAWSQSSWPISPGSTRPVRGRSSIRMRSRSSSSRLCSRSRGTSCSCS